MQRRAVLIFARSPRAEAAAKRVPERIFRDVLDGWRRAARACGATAIVATSQRGGTFGERLANAAADAFAAGFETLLVTGIDTPPVPSIGAAFEAVESGASRAAIAPSTDGGVNIIVLKSAAVLESFAQRDRDLAARCIEHFGGRVFLLPSSTDIDSPRSLRTARREPVWSTYFVSIRFAENPVRWTLCPAFPSSSLRAPPKAPPRRRTPSNGRTEDKCPATTFPKTSRASVKSRRPIPSSSTCF